MSKNHNKLNFATKTGAALMAGIALTGCVVDGESTPVPTVTVTATETVTAEPSPREVESTGAAEGFVELTAEQTARMNSVLTANALNGFMEVRGDSKDMYNGFGQLMADTGDRAAYVRFANTPDGVSLSTERVYYDDKGDIVSSDYREFSNGTTAAMKSTEDGVLTTLEAKQLLSDPATQFKSGHHSYMSGEVIQVVTGDGGVSVSEGPREDAAYSENSNLFDGLTLIGDVEVAEAKLNAFLNTR